MLRSLFVKIFQQNMSLNQRNLRGVPIDLKLSNLDLSGNTTEFKTLRTCPRSHRYNYIVVYIRGGICQNLSFQSIYGENFCTENLVSV